MKSNLIKTIAMVVLTIGVIAYGKTSVKASIERGRPVAKKYDCGQCAKAVDRSAPCAEDLGGENGEWAFIAKNAKGEVRGGCSNSEVGCQIKRTIIGRTPLCQMDPQDQPEGPE